METAKTVVSKPDGLDEVPVAMRSDLVTKLAKRGDATRLASAYDANTLQKIISAAGSGGSKGDDLLDKATDLAKSGKAADVARLADELGPAAFRWVLETDSVSSGVRLLDEGGLTGSRLENVIGQVKKLNGNNGGEGYLLQFLESGKRFNLGDIDFVAKASSGDEVYLINSNKWKSGTSFDKGVHDFRHIVVRHVPPGAPGSWPVKAGTEAGTDTSMYPSSMGPDEVKKAIKTTIKNADPSDVTKEGFNMKIEYSGSKLPAGINEMRVVYKKSTGRIVTAFPPKNS